MYVVSRVWWYTSLFPALGRQRQEDLSEFEASLIYKVQKARAGYTETLSQKAKMKKQKCVVEHLIVYT